MQQNSGSKLGLLAIFLIVMGCLAIVGIGAGCYLGYKYLIVDNILGLEINNPIEIVLGPSATPARGVTPTAPRASTSTPGSWSPEAALQTLKTLSEVEVPNNDPRDLIARYKGIQNIPEVMEKPTRAYKEGDQEEFWVVNGDTDIYSKVKVSLAYATPHLYFWIQDGVKFTRSEVQKLCDTFEDKIYPTNRQFFGSEWTPGIDGDPHLYVVYTKGLGTRVAGYFSSADSVHPLASAYSNGHEMFVMNSASMTLKDQFIYTVLAHEFQHMIHWYRDRNEESWLNEGFSELAAFLNGYDVGGHDYSFALTPDLQLNDWPNDKNITLPHYGASFLFVDYFLNRFGPQATQELVSNSDNGLKSVDGVLNNLGVTDKTTGKPVSADDVFVDWTLTNYLRDKTVGDGRFFYSNYTNVPRFKDTETIKTCPVEGLARTVNQYGADYLRIACRGKVTLNFKGAREVGVLPASAHSGQKAFWSNKGDESDMSLTQTFDLTNLKGAATLTYWTWYDLELNYDFVHLSVSEDGQSWKILKTPSGTDKNISGNSFGWGYNGLTRNWIQEKVDLSSYVGKKVQVRFEYITDAAVNGEGMLLDDIAIPELGYKTDFEKDDGGWQAAGFVRIENRLPQTYKLSLIREDKTKTVEYLDIKDDQTLSLTLDLSSDVVLVVSGSTRFTRLPATYEISILP